MGGYLLFSWPASFTMLAVIQVFSGIATSGINFSINNPCFKLVPADDAIVYLAAKNVVTALFTVAAPLVGGLLAVFLSKRHLSFSFVRQWGLIFLFTAIPVAISLILVKLVIEEGEVDWVTLLHVSRSF